MVVAIASGCGPRTRMSHRAQLLPLNQQDVI